MKRYIRSNDTTKPDYYGDLDACELVYQQHPDLFSRASAIEVGQHSKHMYCVTARFGRKRYEFLCPKTDEGVIDAANKISDKVAKEAQRYLGETVMKKSINSVPKGFKAIEPQKLFEDIIMPNLGIEGTPLYDRIAYYYKNFPQLSGVDLDDEDAIAQIIGDIVEDITQDYPELDIKPFTFERYADFVVYGPMYLYNPKTRECYPDMKRAY